MLTHLLILYHPPTRRKQINKKPLHNNKGISTPHNMNSPSPIFPSPLYSPTSLDLYPHPPCPIIQSKLIQFIHSPLPSSTQPNPPNQHSHQRPPAPQFRFLRQSLSGRTLYRHFINIRLVHRGLNNILCNFPRASNFPHLIP